MPRDRHQPEERPGRSPPAEAPSSCPEHVPFSFSAGTLSLKNTIERSAGHHAFNTLVRNCAEQVTTTERPAITDPATCPGGPRRRRGTGNATEASIRPFEGYWIHFNTEGAAELLPCESSFACVGPGAGGAPAAAPAVCGEHATGFMCADCEPGFVKVAEQCGPCPGFDYGMLALQLLSLFGMALFLLHNSTKPTISVGEIARIWDKVDKKGAGCADPPTVRAVLRLLGVTTTSRTDAGRLFDTVRAPPAVVGRLSQTRPHASSLFDRGLAGDPRRLCAALGPGSSTRTAAAASTRRNSAPSARRRGSR